MGFWQSLLSWLNLKKKKANIVVVGLDNSGKSSIVQYLKAEKTRQQQQQHSVPTIGFQVETFQNGGLSITAFDMSGQSRYRSLWESYYAECHGIVFVIDSTDTMRMAVASNELQLMLKHPDMVNKPYPTPVLILANKSDLTEAIPITQVKDELGLDAITSRSIHIEASSALTGAGLDAAFQWLSERILHSLKND